MKKFKLILIACALILLSCSKNDKSVLLRLKYEPGDNQTFTIQTKTKNTGSAKIDNETEVTFQAVSITPDGSNIKLNANIDAIRSDTEMMGYKSHYDSRDKSPQPEDRSIMSMFNKKVPDSTYTNILNNSYTVTLDNRGRIMSPLQGVRRKTLTSPVNMKLIQLSFPDKAVKEGFTWSETQTNPLFQVDNIFTYTIDKITDDKINITTTVEVAGPAAKKSIKGEGEYVIDPKNGHLLNAYIEIPLNTGSGYALISVFPK